MLKHLRNHADGARVLTPLWLLGWPCCVALAWAESPPPPKTDSPAVRFTYRDDAAQTVSLAGEFSGWNAAPTPLRRAEGCAWSVEMPLATGRYQYKFVMDGRWLPDPGNAETTDDTPAVGTR